jgi:hypothetical protein
MLDKLFTSLLGGRHSPMVPKVDHVMPEVPRATRENPTVAPTMLCVPEMGSLKYVATINHMALPAVIKKKTSNFS